MSANIRIAAELVDQTLRFNPHFHRNAIVIVQTLLQPRNKERHFADGSQTDAAELHRRAGLQATNRVFEEHHVIDMLGKDRILDALLIVKQVIFRFVRHRLAEVQSFRNIEAHPAAKQRRQRAHLDAHPRRGQINGDPAVLPEANVSGHQAVIRRVDEQLISDMTFLRIKGAGFHRPHAITAEQHRVAWRQLACLAAFQQNPDPLGIRRGQRRRIQQRILRRHRTFRPRLQFNIGPGQ